MFKKYSLAVIIIFSSSVLYASPEQSNDSHNSVEETTGFLSGAILGGLAGGPPGVIIGAGFGVFLGDKWRSNKEALEAAQVALQQSNLELTLTRSQFASLDQKYNSINSQLHKQLVSYNDNSKSTGGSGQDAGCCEAEVSIHFKIGNSEIEEHYKEGLKLIASQAKKMENSKIEISGYADRTGDAVNNLALSEKRSNSVKRFLTQSGINHTSITTTAYGDTKPLTPISNYGSDFFDRRVTIHIRTDESFVTKTLVNDFK